MNDTQHWYWLNEPSSWQQKESILHVITENNSDFWQSTWYGFQRHSGHVYGCDVTGDFTFQVCVKGDFTTLYDQAGIMLLQDEKHWLKAGIEYNDANPMIGSVLTNERSDWATGIYPGDAGCFWLRLTLIDGNLRLQYSCDGKHWPLLRLSPFPVATSYFIGLLPALAGSHPPGGSK